ncbi:MAG: phospholipase A [Thiobacillaceae bacterium]|jgi:phospholipase A1|nr:phospholipase A [Thiobacillaceae bacterium]
MHKNTSASLRAVLCLAVLGMASATPAQAAAPASLADCAAIPEDAARLRCYDQVARAPRPAPAEDVVAISPVAATGKAAAQVTPLSARWELDPESQKGVWSFRPHKPSYFLFGRYTDDVNIDPYIIKFDEDVIDDVEVKFQLSFKVKALEDMFGSNADLWFGYTQQSNWQLYNDDISSPFRETNYEPEVFVSFPTRYDLLGLTGRFVNVGFVHQSNGRSDPLSRSWNRLYAQFGFEYGDNFSLLFKPWYRIEEDGDDDDNPDITDFVGDFELLASYRLGGHTLSALGRTSFELEHGFLQLDWTFPLYQNLKGYVQATTGYGESLLDYNHQQNTIGIGISLVDWM